jgi:hypothetical protein
VSIDANIYFGIPGSLLTVPQPRGGISALRSRLATPFQLGSGGQQYWRTLSGKRTYQLGYQSLDYATYVQLHAFDQGHNGVGPFAILDPGQRNQLTANQSAATSLTNGTDNFTVSGSGGSASSDSGAYLRGPRSLKWAFSITNPASALLSLDSPAGEWPGIPVVSRSLCFWCYAKAATGSVTLQTKLTWLNAAGVVLSTSTSNATAASSGSWTQVSIADSPAVGAAYVNCSVAASGASVTAGEAVYLDEFMLNEGTAPDSAWTAGTGVVPVQVVSLGDTQPWFYPDFRSAPGLVLQEVGP